MVNTKNFNILFGFISLLIWIFSLALPAIYVCRGETELGYQILLIGWMGIIAGQIGWLANLPLIWITARLLSGRTPSSFPLIVSIFLVATSFRFFQIDGHDGGNYEVCAHGFGFYAWVALPIYFSIIMIFQLMFSKKAA